MHLFQSNLGSFSLLRLEKPHFLARTHMEYFHLGIFMTLGGNLIKKYECHAQAFFSVFQSFSGNRASLLTPNVCEASRTRCNTEGNAM